MSKYISVFAILSVFLTGSVMAQNSTDPDDSSQNPVIPRQTFGHNVECREQPLQFFRPTNQCGINMFETPKENKVPFDKLRVEWGAAFTQEFQSLKHRNETEPPIELARIGGSVSFLCFKDWNS